MDSDPPIYAYLWMLVCFINALACPVGSGNLECPISRENRRRNNVSLSLAMAELGDQLRKRRERESIKEQGSLQTPKQSTLQLLVCVLGGGFPRSAQRRPS